MPLADAPPEARRDAPPEDDGEEPGGGDLPIGVGRGRRPHEEVRLGQVEPRDVEGAVRRRGRRAGRGRRPERGRGVAALLPLGREEPEERLRLERSDGDEKRPFRPEDLAKPLHQPAARQGADGLVGPEDRGAEGMVGPVGTDKRLVETVLGNVVRLGHLFEDDLPLGLDILGREGRCLRQVEEERERVGEPFGGRPGVDRHPLLRGVGVAVAAEPVGRPGDGRAGAAPGAPEEEVLEEVGRPENLGVLVGRAARHVDAEGDAPHVAHRVEPDGEAVAESPGFHGADLTVGAREVSSLWGRRGERRRSRLNRPRRRSRGPGPLRTRPPCRPGSPGSPR